MSLRRALLLALALASVSQALVLGAYYVGTDGCACATLTVGTPPPSATQRMALALAVAGEPALHPATYLEGRIPPMAAAALGQAHGAWGIWEQYVVAGLFNTLAWAGLAVLPLWAASLCLAWVRRRPFTSRAV